MAEFCKLCSAKLGFFGIYCVQIKGRDINLCEKCSTEFYLVKDSVTDEESFNKNLAAFRAKHNNSEEFQFFDNFFKGVYESDKATKIRENNKKLHPTEEQLIGPFTDREYIYAIAGTKDKHIVIFNDRVVITSNPSFLKTLVYDVIDSEKVIYFIQSLILVIHFSENAVNVLCTGGNMAFDTHFLHFVGNNTADVLYVGITLGLFL